MKWLILFMASCLAIGLFMLILALKVRRQGPVGMHQCGRSDGCRCFGNSEKGLDYRDF
jgi:hypothetical protein